MFFFLIKCIFALALLCIVLFIGRTWQIEHSKEEVLFINGKAPAPAPEGFYAGSVAGPKVSWLGKKFESASAMGINVFDDGAGGSVEKYPFKTSYQSGLRNKDLTVLSIDYNISGNPLWLRPILDEIVEVAPGEYLGKLHLRLLPGYAFTLAYFRLKK